MNELRNVAKKMRYATAIVKIAPFVCAIAYAVCIIAYLWAGDTFLFLLDTLFYTSPMMVALMYVMGVVFEMCKWHKLECLILLLPTIVSLLDVILLDLSVAATWINWVLTAIVVLGSLYNAYRMFWQDGKADE